MLTVLLKCVHLLAVIFIQDFYKYLAQDLAILFNIMPDTIGGLQPGAGHRDHVFNHVTQGNVERSRNARPKTSQAEHHADVSIIVHCKQVYVSTCVDYYSNTDSLAHSLHKLMK